MIALAVASTVKICMGNHYYIFGGKILKQSHGGTIGIIRNKECHVNLGGYLSEKT